VRAPGHPARRLPYLGLRASAETQTLRRRTTSDTSKTGHHRQREHQHPHLRRVRAKTCTLMNGTAPSNRNDRAVVETGSLGRHEGLTRAFLVRRFLIDELRVQRGKSDCGLPVSRAGCRPCRCRRQTAGLFQRGESSTTKKACPRAARSARNKALDGDLVLCGARQDRG